MVERGLKVLVTRPTRGSSQEPIVIYMCNDLGFQRTYIRFEGDWWSVPLRLNGTYPMQVHLVIEISSPSWVQNSLDEATYKAARKIPLISAHIAQSMMLVKTI